MHIQGQRRSVVVVSFGLSELHRRGGTEGRAGNAQLTLCFPCGFEPETAAAATEASSFWAQLSSEFSTHSLQALLQAAPATNAGAVKETLWRRALESWIAAQLRGQWQPNQDGVDPGTSVAGPQLSTSTMPSAPPVADGNPAYAAAMTQLLQSQGYQGMYPPMVFPGMLGAGFGGAPASEAGASQANGSAFPGSFAFSRCISLGGYHG